MARFFQFHPSIIGADAIGYTIRALHRVLRQSGHSSFMLCSDPPPESREPGLHHLSGLADLVWRPDDIFILHHSFANDDLAAILRFPVRKLLVYHNVTPSDFFNDAGLPQLAEAADRGRRQLDEIAPAVDLAVADSEYNRAELTARGFTNRVTIPVFYNDAFFTRRDLDWPLYEETRRVARVNLVFVGRFAPNKRIDRLFEAAGEYVRLFGDGLRLHLIGKIFDEGYTATLLAKAAERRILSALRLHLDADPLRLKTLLAAADAFVCFSEHEGFMVPVVEAFATGCPVIARRAAAVGETMGGAGLALDDPEPALVAGLIELLRRDRQTRRAILRDQFRRAAHFRTELTAQRWKDLLRREFDVPFATAPC